MDNIRLINFRNIEDSGEIKLKPLTIFVGKNGSGKSSILRLFPLIQQSLSMPRKGPLLWYSEEGVDFGDFKATVRNGENFIKIGFTEKINSSREPFDIKVLMKIVQDESLNKIQNDDIGYDKISEVDLEFLGNTIHIDYIKQDESNIKINELEPYSIKNSLFSSSLIPIPSKQKEDTFQGFAELKDCLAVDGKYEYGEAMDFIGLSFEDFKGLLDGKGYNYNVRNTYNNIVKAYLGNLLFNLAIEMNMELSNLSYIGPFRELPKRYYRYLNMANHKIDMQGKNMAVFVNALKKDNKLTAFNEDLEKRYGFSLESESHFGHISLKIKKDGKLSNIVDNGFGYSQLMPVLLALYSFKKSPSEFRLPDEMLCIEQPELHLHPQMQYTFGETLVDAVKIITEKDANKNILIETHSRSIIDAVGAAISKGEIHQDSVVVYLFETKDNISTIKATTFDSDGYLTNWPLGFLD